MTASAPPLAFMIVNSGPRWLPEPETFGSSRGGGAALKAQLAISRNPPVGIEIVREPFRRVESSLLDSVFLYVTVA
jgi:hypothetical protein